MRRPLRQLVQRIFEASSALARNAAQDRPLIELSNTLRLELIQQTEQSLNQLLTQQAGTRLQVEQQQPLQFNLNIPLLVDQQSRNLQLKVKQKHSANAEEAEQLWDIELSFEFGLLGLITTRIQLQGKKISANFWAVQANTKQMIDRHLDEFKTQLSRAGFELGLFDCFAGAAPEVEQSPPYPLNDNLLDIQA